MHEQSLVIALLKQVDDIRRQYHGDRVTEVRVEIGPLSGVEPMLLDSAFRRLVGNSPAAQAQLVIDSVELRAECRTCRHAFEIADFHFRCPKCGGNVRVIRGDQIQLVSVSLHDHRPTPETTP